MNWMYGSKVKLVKIKVLNSDRVLLCLLLCLCHTAILKRQAASHTLTDTVVQNYQKLV